MEVIREQRKLKMTSPPGRGESLDLKDRRNSS
jgi:hypothetical protein